MTGGAAARGSFVDGTLSLGTFATVTTTTRNQEYWGTTATAMFTDTITATESGFLDFVWQLEGSVSCSYCPSSAMADLAGLEIAGNGDFFFSFGFDGSGTLSPTLATFSLPVIAGTPVDLSIRMIAYTHIENAFPGSFATADFLNTATLLSVATLDENRQPIAGSVISNSGLTYPVSTPVPEPSTLLLLGTGAFSLGVRRRRPTHR